MSPGFRRVGEESVYRGYAIELAVGTFEGPDGSRFTRDILHHPGAVAVVPLHPDDTLTLVRQYRAPLDAELLEIPAGLRDVDDESPAETARRELAEEVGLEADIIEPLVAFHNAAGHSDEIVHVFVATGLRSVAADRQGPEERAMAIERHSLDELSEMISAGTLTDAKTVISVALLRSR